MAKFCISEDFLPCQTPCPGLYLGTIHDALRLDPKLFVGVISIGVNWSLGYPSRHPNELRVRVSDDPHRDDVIKKQMSKCVAFLSRCLKVGAVLVYSQAGTFRWTAVIGAAYMIAAHDYGVEYSEYAMRYKFDENFRGMLLRFKFKCFKTWLNEKTFV